MVRLLRIEQMAGYMSWVFTLSNQRLFLRTTRCDLDLRNSSILCKLNLFKTTLSAEPAAIGMSVIKDIPFAVYFHNTAMVVSRRIYLFLRRFICIDMAVTVTDN